MPGLTTPVGLKALYTTLFNTFSEVAGKVSTDLSVLATRVPSSDLFNTYAWLGNFPKFREWIGQRAVQGLKQRAYTIYNKDYELTIGVDRNVLDDARMAEANMIVSGMAEEAARLPRDLLIDLLVNGQTRVCYDGQYFFDTDHPTDPDLGAGTQSNYQASAFALTRANFIAARATMRAYKGENGRAFGVGMSGLVVVVPPELEQTAIDILRVDNVVAGTGMQTNTLKGAAEILVVPELSAASTTAWYLFDTSGALKPLILQERQAPRITPRTSPTDDNLFWHKEYIFGADARMGAGYGAWQKAFKGVG